MGPEIYVRHWFNFSSSCVAVTEYATEGPVRGGLLFLHGRFGHAEMWSRVIDGLRTHYRCLALDLPGHGRSYDIEGPAPTLRSRAELVGRLIERFSHEHPLVLVGHDLGAAIAELGMMYRPDCVAGLVLINPAAATIAVRSLPGRIAPLRLRLKLRALLREAKLGDEDKRLLASPWRKRESRAGLCRALKGLVSSWPEPRERKALAEALSALARPVMLLWGARDSLNPSAAAPELLHSFPDADLFEHESLGHWPWLEEPAWVCQKMRDFLFRVPGLGALPPRRMASAG